MSDNNTLAGKMWDDYYERFHYFSRENICEGCHPRIMEHSEGAPKSIVLTHGLTDSLYFLNAIGNFFHSRQGYNVYLPYFMDTG